MSGSTIGAHRASPIASQSTLIRVHRDRNHGRARHARARLILGLALAGSVLTSLAAAPAAGATTTLQTTPQAAVVLTNTVIDRPWYSVERYYLGLLNCTRTGGWVLSNGTCSGYGSAHYSKWVTPIGYLFGLSDKVTRPYAKLLVMKATCSHYVNGDPGYRLRNAGYSSWNWAENIGCRDGYSTAKAAVLASHLKFQSEKSTNGGHWRNMKNWSYDYVGIGVWRSGTRTRLVIDFYG